MNVEGRVLGFKGVTLIFVTTITLKLLNASGELCVNL